MEASKAVTSAAVTALAAQYHIVADGMYAPGDDTKSLDHYEQRAQRTSIGVKADGTVVLVCTAGRSVTDSAPGLTIPELGALMLELGCEVAYNLDGGGSSQMITKAEGRGELHCLEKRRHQRQKRRQQPVHRQASDGQCRSAG